MVLISVLITRNALRPAVVGICLATNRLLAFECVLSGWNPYYYRVEWTGQLDEKRYNPNGSLRSRKLSLFVAPWFNLTTRLLVWDQLVDFVTSRRNSVNGKLYLADPTIFAYTILGEVIPISSQLNAIVNLVSHVSTRLKMRDSNHLVGSGGLLHMSLYSGYYNPYPYWQDVYSQPNVDFCMMHVYQDPKATLPINQTAQASEWTQLGVYASFCKSLGKPFIVDEFGLDQVGCNASTHAAYVNFAFDALFETVPRVSVVQMWNWSPAAHFSLFPMSEVTSTLIIRANAIRWGYNASLLGTVKDLGTNGFQLPPSTLGTSAPPPVTVSDFESSVSSSVSQSTFASFQRSSLKSSHGISSLLLKWQFTATSFATQKIILYPDALTSSSSNWTNFLAPYGKLSCDAFIEGVDPSSPPVGYMIRFQVVGSSGKIYFQSIRGVWNNFILPNQWCKVYFRLDFGVLADEVEGVISDLAISTWISDLASVNVFTVELWHQQGIPAMSGNLYLDYCRLEVMDVRQGEVIVGPASIAGSSSIHRANLPNERAPDAFPLYNLLHHRYETFASSVGEFATVALFAFILAAAIVVLVL